MQTVLVPPNSDAGPNEYSPTPSQAHYLNVREDPHDGDATILVPGAGGLREVWGLDVSAIPDGSLVISVTIRSVEKQTAAGPSAYHVGFIIGGVDYFGPTHSLSAGSSYITENDPFTVDPSDGAAWTKARLARAFLVHEQISQEQGLPRPRVTECIVLADIILPPERPTGTAAAIVPGASGAAPTSPSGIAAAVVGGLTMAGIAPVGGATMIVGMAAVASVVGNVALGVDGPSASLSDPGKPSAIPLSMNPSAAPSPITPTGIPAVIP